MLSVKNIKKTYAGVAALRGITIDLDVGLTAIVGDNGAGKSTLMKILSGVVRPDDGGEIVMDGSPVTLDSPTRARSLGIESLYQDLALADTLDVASNVFLGRELVKRRLLVPTLDDKAMRRAAEETLKAVGIGIPDVKLPVRQLSGGQRQAVALARAMYFSAQVILLDEPTAALGPKETAAFTKVVRGFVERHTTVCMVTHNLPQVMELADRIVVMRAGRVVATMAVSEVTEEQLLGLMVGSAAAV